LAVAFAHVLRQRGLPVTPGEVTCFIEALGVLGIDDRRAVELAGQATLVHRPEDLVVYRRAFASFWLGMEFPARRPAALPVLAVAVEDPEDQDGPSAPPQDAGAEKAPQRVALLVSYSPTEMLRHKDFGAYSHAEFDEARRLMADLRLAGSLRRSRRRRPHRRRALAPAARPDLRRTVRRALRTGGEPVERAWSVPAERPRRVVLLCDVSGSMEPYTRALMRFAHAAVVGRTRVEAFALGTRLTRLTRALSSRDPDMALAAAARTVTDWSGGTRLGEALRTFNDTWGVKGMARGAVVVILSDGWDRGDAETLAAQMERLSRVAHKVVWVNPLKASPGYVPLAKGMAAALPFVDEFVEGHSLAALEELTRVIGI